jgi:integrase
MARRPKYTGSLYQRKPDGIWQMQYIHDGRMHRESTKTYSKEEAGKILSTRLRTLRAGEEPPKQSTATMSELATLWMQAHEAQWKPATANVTKCIWEKNIEPLLGKRQPGSILPADLEIFISRLKAQGFTETYINRHIVIVRAILQFGIRNKVVREMPEFPSKFDERPYIRHGYIDDWDFIRLCEEIEEKDTWLLALVACAFTFGFRRGELLGMRVNQVDLERHWITLPAGSTKTKMPRRIILNPEGKISKLLTPLVQGKQPHAYVFSRDAQGSIPVRDFRVEWAKAVKASGIKTGSGPDGLLHFHDLRRSAITRMAGAGLSEAESMAIAGHLSQDVHRRYKQLSEGAAQRLASKIDLPE